ncbi:MAG: cytochrome d ubiquinol oxidase subunit II [Bacteroidales bacterium]|nr:cytochrome d ubiquinol oxidase subunit II [Bacteroidales bacterium]
METLQFLQLYWWAVVSLLGALLVFLLFVQGGQTLIFSTASSDEQRNLLIGALGHKWELTFTTLVTFGGAAFASFPLFYSTSFGGAYWLWMSILFLFVLQAVSYEFRNKAANLLGTRTYDIFLFLNGVLGTILLGVAVGTLYSGGAYYMDKLNITDIQNTTISHWANGWMGLEAIAEPFNLLLGIVVFLAARTLGSLFAINELDTASQAGKELSARCRVQLKVTGIAFVLAFVAFLVMLFLRTGYTVEEGVITPVKYKYFFNFVELVWPAILLVAGVVLVLAGLGYAMFADENSWISKKSFYVTGGGVVLAVWALLICAAYNNTAYFPSTVSLQDSLTLANSSSSLFTLKVMAYVSIAVPFVLWYIIVVWRKMSGKHSEY